MHGFQAPKFMPRPLSLDSVAEHQRIVTPSRQNENALQSAIAVPAIRIFDRGVEKTHLFRRRYPCSIPLSTDIAAQQLQPKHYSTLSSLRKRNVLNFSNSRPHAHAVDPIGGFGTYKRKSKRRPKPKTTESTGTEIKETPMIMKSFKMPTTSVHLNDNDETHSDSDDDFMTPFHEVKDTSNASKRHSLHGFAAEANKLRQVCSNSDEDLTLCDRRNSDVI